VMSLPRNLGGLDKLPNSTIENDESINLKKIKHVGEVIEA